MNLISPVHLLFIAAIALIFVGPKRLPELTRALGVGMREFRDVLNGGSRDDADSDENGELEVAGAAGPPPTGPFG